MRQKWKIHIKFGVFKSKRLEWVWRVLVWENSKNFTQYEVTKWRKIRHKNLPKRSDLLWKGDMWEDSVRRLPGKSSWKSSSALYFRWLTGKSSQKSFRSEKPAYPNPDLKNLHLQKRSNDLKTEKMSGILDRSTFIEHTKIHI